jgi:D-3-phosphoglycerate dehydrogenase / 2-oxoglutarate reductase
MSTFRVVVTDQVFPTVDLERELLAGIDAELIVASGERDQVLELARDADALLNTYLSVDADFVAELSRCKIIARYGIGVDNIDLDAAAAAGIAVTNVPDYSVEEVATHTVTMLLALVRRLEDGLATVRDGEWGIARVRPLRRMSTLTVGLVGFGRISRRVARVLDALDVRYIVFDPYLPPEVQASIEPPVTFVDTLDELLEAADAVSLHAPLTDETRGMIGRRELELLGADGLLVNTSRGPLIDVPALIQGLHDGVIRAAALDVTDPEPPTDPAALAAVPGLLVTPHVAFYSEEALEESQRKATTQVIKQLTGEELDYRVN